MSESKGYTVLAPRAPGLAASAEAGPITLEQARRYAQRYATRADLKRQSVWIETYAGTFIEYAGPTR